MMSMQVLIREVGKESTPQDVFPHVPATSGAPSTESGVLSTPECACGPHAAITDDRTPRTPTPHGPGSWVRLPRIAPTEGP